MRTLIEELIRELLKKKTNEATENEFLAEIKKVYDEKSVERSRFGVEMKEKKQVRHEREYQEFKLAKEIELAKEDKLEQ